MLSALRAHLSSIIARRSLLGALVLVALLSPAAVASAAAGDAEGAEDHPLVTRYPGSRLAWQHEENFRPFRVPLGPITGYRTIGEWADVEGRVSRSFYELATAERTHAEVYANYRDALKAAGFEVLAAGLHVENSRKPEVGTRAWQDVYLRGNPLTKAGAASAMTAGSATSGGSGTLIARGKRDAGTVYAIVSVYQFREDLVATLVDIVELAEVESGLISVDAEAIGRAIASEGRVVLEGLLFDYDRATLRAESESVIDEIAAYLAAHPDKHFFVVGHTDDRGELAYNLDLSRRRAGAVVDALCERKGVARERLEAHGVGPLSPIASKASEAGRDKNRRVELVER